MWLKIAALLCHSSSSWFDWLPCSSLGAKAPPQGASSRFCFSWHWAPHLTGECGQFSASLDSFSDSVCRQSITNPFVTVCKTPGRLHLRPAPTHLFN